jgi:hypothetical protein
LALAATMGACASSNEPPSTGSPAAAGDAGDAGAADARPACPPAGARETLVTEERQFIPATAVDDTHVYYATEPMDETPHENVLWRAPLAGGPSQELARSGRILQLLATTDSVYWISTGQGRQELHRLPKAGGPAVLVSAPTESPTEMIRGPGDTIIHDSYPDGRILRRDASGGTTVITSATREHLGTFLLDGETLYVSQVAAQSFEGGYVGETSLYALPLAGGAPKTIYGPFARESLGSFAVDAKDVYVSRGPQGIAKLPKGGGEPVLIETGGETTYRDGAILGGAGYVQVDEDAIYWIDWNLVTSPMTGNIVRKKKSGAPREVLATTGLPDNLELGACHAYFTGQEKGATSIFRVGK